LCPKSTKIARKLGLEGVSVFFLGKIGEKKEIGKEGGAAAA
jgi:hypothetical protein